MAIVDVDSQPKVYNALGLVVLTLSKTAELFWK